MKRTFGNWLVGAVLLLCGGGLTAAEPERMGDNAVNERLGLFQNARQLLVSELRSAGVDTDSQVMQASDKVQQFAAALNGAESDQTRRNLESGLSRGALLFTKLAKQVREFSAAAGSARFPERDRAEVAAHFVNASRSAALCVGAAAEGNQDVSERAAIDFQVNLLMAQETAAILFNHNVMSDVSARLEKVGSDKALSTEKYYQQIATLQTDLLRKRYAAERGMILGHFATQTGPTQREALTQGYEHALDQLLKNSELLSMVKQEAEGVIAKAYEQKNKVLDGALNGGGEPISGSAFLKTQQ